jgi:hypothetical protein
LAQENCDDISEWTPASTTGSGWTISSGQCTGEVDTDWEEAGLVTSASTSSTSEFCSFRVVQIAADDVKLGCIFRAPPDCDDPGPCPGDHYTAYFNNNNNNWALENHNGDDASKHGYVDDVTGTGDCSCTAVGGQYDYVDLSDNDYAGIVLSGTGASTAITFYNFGGTQPGSMTNPATATTWAAQAALTGTICECDATAVGTSDLTEIDTAGRCGPESTGVNNVSDEPDIDDFACGDTP